MIDANSNISAENFFTVSEAARRLGAAPRHVSDLFYAAEREVNAKRWQPIQARLEYRRWPDGGRQRFGGGHRRQPTIGFSQCDAKYFSALCAEWGRSSRSVPLGMSTASLGLAEN